MALRLTLLLALFCAQAVQAHPAPFSYLDVHLDAGGVRGSVVIHDFDAAHELGLTRPEQLLRPATAGARSAELVRLIEERLRITGDTQTARFSWGGIEVLSDRQSLRFPFELSLSAPGRLDIRTTLFPYDPNHQTFVNLYEAGRLKHQAILDAHRSELTYYAGSAQGRWAVMRTFVSSGIHHILIGPDHILFLLGLMLLGGSLWRLATIVTAFTLGHSITLSLAALDIVQVAPGLVEPAIALSIVVVGVDNLLVQSRPEYSGTHQRDLRPWLAIAFGLIHGFGFAAVLLEFGLPREALGWSLAAFNVGVEIGQLAIVVVMAAALTLLRRHHELWAQRFVVAGSIGVIAAGSYWFIQRVWFTAA